MIKDIEKRFRGKRSFWVLIIILVAVMGVLIYGLQRESHSQRRVLVFDHAQFGPQESTIKSEAESGVVKSQLDLGIGYLKGNFSWGVNYPEAEKWLKKVANNDTVQTPQHLLMRSSAMEFLAGMYKEGKGVPRDYSEAMRWYLSSSEIGSESAKCAVGDMYYLGEGVEKSVKDAEKWWKIPSSDLTFVKSKENLNDAASQLYLANVYRNNSCPYPHSALAQEWYRKAADQGNVKAQLALTVMLRGGKSNPEKLAESSLLVFQLAEQGDPEAQFLLAGDFRRGRNNREKDLTKALHWYLKSAQSGNARAQGALGTLYYFGGQGVFINKREAYFWLTLAQKNGELTSPQDSLKKRLESDLSPNDLADIKLQVQKWAPQ